MPVADIYNETKHLNNPIVIEAPALSGGYKYDTDIALLQAIVNAKFPISYSRENNFKENPSFDFFQGEEVNTLFEANNINEILPVQCYTENLKKLTTSFNKELKTYQHYISDNTEATKDVFNEIASQISYLTFEKATVELTKSNSIKFTLIFPGNKLLMISKPISPLEDFDEDGIAYSLFVDRELIAANVSKASTFVEGFQEYMSM